MRISNTIILSILITCFIITTINISASEPTIMLSGQWGTKNDEIGVIYPSNNVLPTAPKMCLGGFTVDASSTIWISDSINNLVKKYFKGKVSTIKIASKFIGELCTTNKFVFVITIMPNEVLIFSKSTNKQLKQISIPFKNPGRIFAISDKYFYVEEIGHGLWVYKNGKVFKHPSNVLEAVGNAETVYGTEFRFEEDSRNIISSKLDKQLQEPELFYAFNTFPKDRIVYSKLFGIIDAKPILATVESRDTNNYQLYKLNGNKGTFLHTTLPILDGPFLDYSWKIINDKFYVFSGTTKNGWNISEFKIIFK